MPYCTSCGNEVSVLATTCPRCGNPVESPELMTPESSSAPGRSPAPVGGPRTELRPLGIGEIVDVAIKIFFRNFKTLIIAVAVVVVPVQVIISLINVSVGTASDAFIPFTQPEPGQVPDFVQPGAIGAVVVGALIMVALALISAQLATGVSFKAVSDAYLGVDPDWRTSLSFAVARLGSLIWLSILIFLIIGGAIAAGAIVIALLASVGRTLGIIVAVPAILAGIAGAIYLAVSWSVSIPSLLLEDERGQKALARSRSLVRGFWWTTAAVLLISFVIRGVAGLVVGGIFGIAFFAVGDSTIGAFLLDLIIGSGSSALATPFTAAVITVLYFDLRVRREGFDLELLARRVGSAPDVELPADPWNPFEPQVDPDAPPPEPKPKRKPPGDDGPTWESR